jgi:DNA-binding CsgD family transcriptional regulator
MGKHGALGFSELEHKIIQMRTHGVNSAEIARRLGISKTSAHNALHNIFKKLEIDDVALLVRWAIATGMDKPLEPETEETREIKQPKVFKQRIKMGRLRRAGLDRVKPNRSRWDRIQITESR